VSRSITRLAGFAQGIATATVVAALLVLLGCNLNSVPGLLGISLVWFSGMAILDWIVRPHS
jgi:hypothetical protein